MIRTAADLASGLAPARPPRPIVRGERIHVVGVAGAGASAAALLAHHSGAVVTGCDPSGPTPYTTAAESLGLELAWRHDPGHVASSSRGTSRPSVDRLAVTKALTAVDPDHAELVAARSHGVPVEAWQQVVADAASTRPSRLVGVAGTHGKSTTSGWLVHVLAAAGHDPSAFVGALLPADVTGGPPATARWGRGDVFVVEADEYAGNFDPYRPDLVVLLDAEWDHPDVFADEGAVIDAFERWVRAAGRRSEPPVLVANADDPGVARLLGRLLDWPGRLLAVTLGAAGARVAADGSRGGLPVGSAASRFRTAAGPARLLSARIAAFEPTRTLIEAWLDDGDRPVRIELGLPGRHMAYNALAVVGAALQLGVAADDVVRGVASFSGVGRRLELKGDVGGVVVIDDYAHHPTAIAATMSAVRQRYPGRRVWAVYEPLTFHRTAAMLDAFADVLAQADRAAVADIWAGRDPDTSITSARALAEAVQARGGRDATAPGSVESTALHLAREARPGDVVLVMGGGRSYVIAERLVALLAGGGGEQEDEPR